LLRCGDNLLKRNMGVKKKIRKASPDLRVGSALEPLRALGKAFLDLPSSILYNPAR
jgi:hypothetical protein